ncbi:MAG: flagellar motor switch protein FliN [Alphaproteobacteria bacterium]|nr:flagellar motor switch protein FliN [Alphaproteobacteria bacterium]
MSDEDFDEDDMMAAIEAERKERAANGPDIELDDEEEMDMAAAMAGEPTRQAAANPQAASEPKTLGDALGDIARSSAIQDIGVDLTAVLGTAEMKVSNLLKIGRGAVIELDRRVGDTVDIRVSGQSIARGEVVVVEDHLAVSITDLVKKT